MVSDVVSSTSLNLLKRSSVWDDINHQRAFLQQLARKLNIKTHEQWYSISQSIFMQHGGGELLSKYNDSLVLLFRSLYPEYLNIL